MLLWTTVQCFRCSYVVVTLFQMATRNMRQDSVELGVWVTILGDVNLASLQFSLLSSDPG